ncbi:MAG: hypothetical protein M1831_004291 [Alyxoria varia]|nr:MAG: hypothetical protein M1831_004291 [Alyxoria varia]
MPPKRMTANPVKPARYRPGKAIAPEHSNSSEESDAEKSNEDDEQKTVSKAPPPKAKSFPSGKANQVAQNLKNVDLKERSRREEAQRKRKEREEFEAMERMEKEAGFVTESEEESTDEEDEDAKVQAAKPTVPPSRPLASTKRREDSGSEETSSSEAEEGSSDSDSDSGSSSSSDAAPRLQRPIFVRKNQRAAHTQEDSAAAAEAEAVATAARKQAEADALVQAKLDADREARAAARRGWDDDDNANNEANEEDIDDTDDLDPELEHQQWVARELARLKRSREVLEKREAEIAEVERRREMTSAEREAEDVEKIEKQREERMGKGKMAYMQRYHHKGAFFGDFAEEDERAKELASRDLAGARFVDQASREALPAYLQERDMTRIGRKGRTRYKDLKTEDTGRHGGYLKNGGWDGRGRSGRDDEGEFGDVADERFRPDGAGGGGRAAGTGANASALGDKRKQVSTPDGDRNAETKRPRID